MNHRPTHYDYQALDKLLTDNSNPQEVGDQLDEIMQVLADHASQDGGYHTRLSDHFYFTRHMRDIFWKLQPTYKASTLTLLRTDPTTDKLSEA